jgi:peptidoglycan hydrolase-like protein with peptidoglycan-binding domain
MRRFLRPLLIAAIVLTATPATHAQQGLPQIFQEFVRPGGLLDTLAKHRIASQNVPLSQRPSIDCSRIHGPSTSAVAIILCSGPDAAAADWDLNSVLWALAGSYSEAQQKALDQDQDRWRSWLSNKCALPPVALQLVERQRQCVISEFHARASTLRSELAGDVLIESRLSPEQHARIQASLINRSFLQSQADGEFGSDTRLAIKKFQEAEGASQTGVLTQTQIGRLATNGLPEIDQRPPGSDIRPPQANEGIGPVVTPSVQLPALSPATSTSVPATPVASPSVQTSNQLSTAVAPAIVPASTPQSTAIAHGATAPQANERQVPMMWVFYLIILTFLVGRIALFWKKAKPPSSLEFFELAASDEHRLRSQEGALQRALQRRYEIFVDAENRDLKRNLDGSFHRGSRLGQKYNDELESLDRRIEELGDEISILKSIPLNKLAEWSRAAAVRATSFMFLGLWILAPVLVRQMSALQLAGFSAITILAHFILMPPLSKFAEHKRPGISAFRMKWSHSETDDWEDYHPSDSDDFAHEENHEEEDEEPTSTHDKNRNRAHEEAPADWRTVLGVPANATREEIKVAWRRKVKEFHSDRLSGIEGLSPEFRQFADRKLAEVNRAYEEAMAST